MRSQSSRPDFSASALWTFQTIEFFLSCRGLCCVLLSIGLYYSHSESIIYEWTDSKLWAICTLLLFIISVCGHGATFISILTSTHLMPVAPISRFVTTKKISRLCQISRIGPLGQFAPVEIHCSRPTLVCQWFLNLKPVPDTPRLAVGESISEKSVLCLRRNCSVIYRAHRTEYLDLGLNSGFATHLDNTFNFSDLPFPSL